MRVSLLLLALADTDLTALGPSAEAGAVPQAPARLSVLLLDPGAAALQCALAAGTSGTLLNLVATRPSDDEHAEYQVESMSRTVISSDAPQLTAFATTQPLSPLPTPARLAASGHAVAVDDDGPAAVPRRRLQSSLPLSLRADEPAMWAVLFTLALLAAITLQLATSPLLWFGRSAASKYEDEGLVTGEGGEGGAYVATAQGAILFLQIGLLIQLGEPTGTGAAAGCGASAWFAHLGGAALLAALLTKLVHLARVGDSQARVRLGDRRLLVAVGVNASAVFLLLLLRSTIPSQVKIWPLQDIAITNIVWCIAYTREFEGGVVYCPIIVQ